MKKCTNCGKDVENKVTICPECGQLISNDNDQLNQGSYFAGFISVLLFSVIGWLFVIFTGKKKTIKAANITILLWLLLFVGSMFRMFFAYLGLN